MNASVAKCILSFKDLMCIDRNAQKTFTCKPNNFQNVLGQKKQDVSVASFLEPQAVAVSPYGWLMTHYGWLAGLSRLAVVSTAAA